MASSITSLHKNINVTEDDHCIRVSTGNTNHRTTDDESSLSESTAGKEYRFRLMGSNPGDFDRYEYIGTSPNGMYPQWVIHLPHYYSRIGSNEPLKFITMIINGDRGEIFKYVRNNYFGRDMYQSYELSLFIPHEISRAEHDKPYDYLSIDFE